MKRRPIVAGNWKMHKTVAEAVALSHGIASAVAAMSEVDVVVCPPFTALQAVAGALKHTTVGVGAQNCSWAAQGAFTGEIAPGMIQEVGARYCIIGHSERRALFGDTNETVAKKTQAVLAQGLIPIVCVGETLAQRTAGQTLAIVEEQLRIGLAPVTPEQAPILVIAYEPVWAIGTGQNATPAQAQEVHACIRQQLTARFSPAAAQAIRLQYGGSVKPDNSQALINQPDIDGFLVGGASLDAASFTAIVQAAAKKPAKESACTS